MVVLRLLQVGVTVTVFGAPLCRGCSQDLAKGKPAYQSSTHRASYAILAVDGNYDDIWHQGSCTHTDHGPGNWWLVDLETVAYVAGATITNRADCCSNRLVNFEVRVGYSFVGTSSFTQYRLCASYPGVAPVGNTSLSCRTPLRGRYVLIIKVGSDDLALQLCEVEVHGISSSARFKLVAAGARASLVPLSTLNFISRGECSMSCLQHWECVAMNVLCIGNDQCTCELLSSTAQSGDLQADTGYGYYEVNCLGAVYTEM